MLKFGEGPYLECSSHGDRRFSAFYARIRGRGNRSIEEIYQGAKVFSNGLTGLSWKEAKGKVPINYKLVSDLYSKLWDEYIDENPELLSVLKRANGLSDMFGSKNSNCQARELWRIRNER